MEDEIARESNNKKEEDVFEDLFLTAGVFVAISFIFLMHNVSIVVGRQIIFSGNVAMMYTELEIWRFILLPVSILLVGILIFISKKRNTGRNKPFVYFRFFLIGICLVFGSELFFWKMKAIFTGR